MKKTFGKVCIVLAAMLFVLLTACQSSNGEEPLETKDILPNEESNSVLPSEELASISSSSEDKQGLTEKAKDPNTQNELDKEPANSAFELPEGAFIIEDYRYSNDNQRVIVIKDGVLQVWDNQNVICEKKIPVPSQISVGDRLDKVIGNPYISEDGRLILVQSYITLENELKINYTVLSKNCRKIIPSLIYDGYVFQNYEGKYGLVFYDDFAYSGLIFNTIDSIDSDFTLPNPTTIWLNESTVESVKFGSWGTTSYGYQDVSAISVRLYVKDYGELDIANACEPFEPVEVDDDFLDLLNERFSPREYQRRLFRVIQTLNEYKRNS